MPVISEQPPQEPGLSMLHTDITQSEISSKLAEDPKALWKFMNANRSNQIAVAQYFLGNIKKNDYIFQPTSTTELALLFASLRIRKDYELVDGMPPEDWAPKLDLSEIGDKVTDKLLGEIAKRIPNLTHVNLDRCIRIREAGLAELAEKCSNLIHVDLTGCDQITDAGLAALTASCPNLTHVNLTRCDNLRTEAIQEAYKDNPNLVIIGPNGEVFEREQTHVQRLADSRGAVEQTR